MASRAAASEIPAGRFTPLHRGGAGAPLACLHGFTDTWRTWQLMLPALERRHDVLAPTLPGHAGGPPLGVGDDPGVLADAVEDAMDAAGWDTAHLAGNSLGGYVTLQLAARGRARSVVAFAPAGGWAPGDPAARRTLERLMGMRDGLRGVAAHADAVAASPEGRRSALGHALARTDHLPPALVAHIILGAAACPGAEALTQLAMRVGWPVDLSRVRCPVRVVWGLQDRVLEWPGAAARWRAGLPADTDWVELGDSGHCPQLDDPLVAAHLVEGFTRP